MQLADHGRYPFSALPTRPDFQWPGARRLAVYIGMNLECFAFGEGLGAQIALGGPQPDVLNHGGATTATVSASGACWRSSIGWACRSPRS